ncbi:4456_t:CDS:2 [Diversispora eburnea]|uniref:4456_t:CDS:1 n=1 Tax=Diversispora eburnea TaxID=1213867 RepID=A0A9N9FPM8_9GLOM|nr:4456_t:CDS:2 [Diversispora eburnea]
MSQQTSFHRIDRSVSTLSFFNTPKQFQMSTKRNRIAAKECRERKKAYVSNLEKKATQMEKENTMLRKKVLELKEKLEYAESKASEKDQLNLTVQELKARIEIMRRGSNIE